MADQQGTWVNLTGDLAEFVPVGEKCSANVKAEQDMYAQELAAAGGRTEPDEIDREAARIMTASESDLDAIIREQGGTPEDYAARGRRAVELAKETIRARNAGVDVPRAPACACGDIERQGWVHRQSHCWPFDESAAGGTTTPAPSTMGADQVWGAKRLSDPSAIGLSAPDPQVSPPKPPPYTA